MAIRTARVDDRGIRLPRPAEVSAHAPIDVRFGANRVWSFTTGHDGRRSATGIQVAWPAGLTARLDGVARVTVVPHAGGEPLFVDDVQFGTSSEPLDLVDDAGHPLSLDKGGRLQRTFDRMDDGARRELIEATHKILVDLTEKCGLDTYLAYGCLLGAARDGRMIGHDSDADVAWLSKHTHPFDIVRESRAAEHTMRELGWRVVRMSAANFKVWVPLPTGQRAGVDVFGSFHIGDHFHITASLRGTLPRSSIMPFGSVTLEGVEFPAPSDVEAFLAYTYGPTWRVPDPAFHFEHPEEHTRIMSGWWRGSRTRLHDWQTFYSSSDADRVPREHSAFAPWVAGRIEPGSRIIELGSGTGRDAFWLADQGFVVTGSDFCPTARMTAKAAGRGRKAGGKTPVRFRLINLESSYNLLTRGAQLAHRPGSKHVYARFLIDALTSQARPGLWRFCSMVGRRGGHTFLEFRTDANRVGATSLEPHACARARPDVVAAEIEAYGGRIVERVEGRDLAPLGAENPVVCRMEVSWTR
ncbi:MAG: class I SAM-dependent methyltransferase [Marmoricola sp.]